MPSRRTDLDRVLEEFLTRLWSMSATEPMRRFAERELSFTQVRILFILDAEGGPVPISHVSGRLGLSLAATGRSLDRLVHEELVVRQEDQQDRRVKLVALSDSARHLLAEHLDCRRDTLRRFTTRLSDPDRERLLAALEPILAGDSLHGTTKDLR